MVGRFLPELPRRHDGRERPWRENCPVLNGILWILRTGAPWADLPARYPSHQTCHRRFQRWVRDGLLRTVLEILAQALHDEGFLDLQEMFIDGSFAPAKRGGACVGKTGRGKGSKIMAIADRQGRRRWPRGVHPDRRALGYQFVAEVTSPPADGGAVACAPRRPFDAIELVGAGDPHLLSASYFEVAQAVETFQAANALDAIYAAAHARRSRRRIPPA